VATTRKQYILFDHDGVLVDTEYWYYSAGARALATIGLDLPKEGARRTLDACTPGHRDHREARRL
jgi:beta-phosphoglucomutase-like phosphatase (HAD superfamily)